MTGLSERPVVLARSASSILQMFLSIQASDATPAPFHQEPFAVSRGQIVGPVACASDANQSYVLYLPSNYTPERRWPILYAFEPPARGRLAVEIFQEAAEKYGYIVAGSNNSRNVPWEPSLASIRAMWTDTHARFSLDERQVYTTGFSGGARGREHGARSARRGRRSDCLRSRFPSCHGAAAEQRYAFRLLCYSRHS
jgi:hypothetical protein